MLLKKWLFLVACFTLSCVSFAQQKPLDGRDVYAYLNQFFSTHQVQVPAAGKKWQVIYVMNATSTSKEDFINWGAVDDNRKAIEKQIREGKLARAALLYSRPDGTTYLEVFPHTLSRKDYNLSDTPEIQYTQVDTRHTSEEQILNQLFSGFASEGYYTAVILHMHGSGVHMSSFIGGKHPVYLPLFARVIKNSGLNVDVLAWNSCYMGTVGNVYAMFEQTNVKYMTVSSNLGLNVQVVTHGGQAASPGAHPLFALLNNQPRQLAKKLVESSTGSRGSFTYNMMVVDGAKFRKQIVPLLHRWNELLGQDGIDLRFQSEADGYPATQFISALQTVLKDSQAGPELKQVSSQLRGLVNTSIFSYRCWDAALHTFYTNISSVPASSKCMAGLSINQDSLNTLSGVSSDSPQGIINRIQQHWGTKPPSGRTH